MLSKVNQEVYPEVGEGVSGDWDDVLTWRLRGCTHLEVQEGVLTWMFRRVFICRFGRCTHLEVGEGVLIWRFGRVYSPGGSGVCTHLEVQEGVLTWRLGRVPSSSSPADRLSLFGLVSPFARTVSVCSLSRKK